MVFRCFICKCSRYCGECRVLPGSRRYPLVKKHIEDQGHEWPHTKGPVHLCAEHIDEATRAIISTRRRRSSSTPPEKRSEHASPLRLAKPSCSSNDSDSSSIEHDEAAKPNTAPSSNPAHNGTHDVDSKAFVPVAMPQIKNDDDCPQLTSFCLICKRRVKEDDSILLSPKEESFSRIMKELAQRNEQLPPNTDITCQHRICGAHAPCEFQLRHDPGGALDGKTLNLEDLCRARERYLEKNRKFECEICHHRYTKRHTYRAHLRTAHGRMMGSFGSARTGCNECGVVTMGQKSLVLHYQLNHCPDYAVSTVTLESMDVFMEWMMIMRYATCTAFFKRANAHNSLHYRCKSIPKRLRITTKVPAPATARTVGHASCTAFVTATVAKNGEVFVSYCFSHSHHFQPRAFRLKGTLLDEKIINYLDHGLTPHQIIELLKAPYIHEINVRCRDVNITPFDITVVKKRAHLQLGRYDDDDLKSLAMLVNKKKKEGIVHFQPTDDLKTLSNFSICIITSLQQKWISEFGARGLVLIETCPVLEFPLRLTTVLVPDTFDRLLPIAFLLTPDAEVQDIQIAFKCIRQYMTDFSPQYIYTDDNDVYWKAFKAEFPDASTHKLFARWNELRNFNWKSKRLRNERNRTRIIHELNVLFEISDITTFTRQLERIHTALNTGENLQSKVAENNEPEMQYDLCTTLDLDYWSDTVYRDVLEGRTNRLDSLVNRLLTYAARYRAHLAIQDPRYVPTTIPRIVPGYKKYFEDYVDSENENGKEPLRKRAKQEDDENDNDSASDERNDAENENENEEADEGEEEDYDDDDDDDEED